MKLSAGIGFGLVLLLASTGLAQQQQIHITLPKDAPTAADARKADFQFYSRYVAVYDQHTKDKAAARQAARTFLQHATANKSGIWFSEEPLVLEDAELTKAAQAALDAGSRDPLVRAFYVNVLLSNGDPKEARQQSQLAVNTSQTGYPPAVQAFARYQLQLAMNRAGDLSVVEAVHPKLLELVPAYFEWVTEKPGMQRQAWKEFLAWNESTRFKPEVVKKLIATYEASERKDPWLLAMLRGWYHYKLAWEARGGGFANTVTPNGAADFAKHNQIAGLHVRQAWKLDPGIPYAPEMMMHIARSGGDPDSVQQWFQRTIEAQVDFWGAYTSMLFTLRPRWGGSYSEMVAFGEACIRTERFDTEIPYVFIQAVSDIRDEVGGWDPIVQNIPDFYKKWRDTLLQLARHPSRDISKHLKHGKLSRGQRKYYTELLALAIKLRQYDDAEAAFKALGDEIDEKRFHRYGLHKKFDLSGIYAGRSLGKQLLDVWNLRVPPHSIEKSRQVAEAYSKLQRDNKEPKADYFLQTIVDQANKELDYDAGKWVDLTFSSDLAEWRGAGELFEVESERSVVACNYDRGAWIQLYHKGYFPGPKEMMVDVEILEQVSPDFFVGAHLGYCFELGHGANKPTGRIFLVEPSRQSAGLGAARKVPELVPIKAAEPYRLHAKVWGPEYFEFYVNGKRVEMATSSPGFTMSSDSVGIGTTGWMLDVGKVRFKDVRVRKLGKRPVQEEATDEVHDQSKQK